MIILGATEFLAALFSIVLFQKLTRRMSLVTLYSFVLLCFFFLLVLKNNQTEYVVTLSTRAALQIIFNILIVTTMEQFPTEVRASLLSLCMSVGLLGGVGLPFFNQLSNELGVIILLMFASAVIGVYFLRETKQEEALINLY